jgi:hypothetical protein
VGAVGCLATAGSLLKPAVPGAAGDADVHSSTPRVIACFEHTGAGVQAPQRHQRIIAMQCGPIRRTIGHDAAAHPVTHPVRRATRNPLRSSDATRRCAHSAGLWRAGRRRAAYRDDRSGRAAARTAGDRRQSNWHRPPARYQKPIETPANGYHRSRSVYQKKSCTSELNDGFSRPSENRGVPGSIPGLASLFFPAQ